MLLNFIKADFREKILVDKYLTLISEGVNPSEILVLVQNSTLKNQFTNKVLSGIKTNAIERLNIHSFFSLVYNTLNDNWCFVENAIPASAKSFILPNLVGLEVSQFILKDILKDIPVRGYNSKQSLLHQIFRRYSLIVQNNLSNSEVEERAKILKEAFADDAELIIKQLLSKTLRTRSLDYLRQTLIFNYVYKNTNCFKNIKYLLVDDADEMTPVCFDFISYLKPQLKDWVICFDSLGSSRCGYLSADTSIEYKLKTLFEEDIQEDNNTFIQGEKIFENVLEGKKERLENFTLTSLSKRAEILDAAILKINKMLEKSIKPKDVTIITPLQDDMLKFTLQEKLNKTCNLLFLSGSEKLISNPLVKASLNILKLMLNIEVTDMDLRSIISDYIGIPLKYSDKIIDGYKSEGKLPDIELDFYSEKYKKFLNAFNEIKEKNEKLSLKVFEIFQTVDFADETKINKFNFFIKQLKDFENVLGEKTVIDRAEEIIVQFENSIIAENPSTTLEISENDLVVATPQKIIDNKISSRYQIWLDVSSSEWVKTDTGPLYNAWVMQADWTKDEYTVEDDVFLSKQKTARILRKLLLLAKEHVYAYSSLSDPSGTENLGGIEEYLSAENDENEDSKPIFQLVPRDDQRPVLEYKKGSMAISAVPGAGKTTILLALIAKLVEAKVNPLNIYVLTYMDSAARNFRERIKNMCPNSTVLPNISTIHG
ncbi:AAA family ATPase, partial [bacterium]|nr:AAA family ATPase [bacterium]